MTTSGFHPTDEELAAYIDRRLGSKDRARVTEHLASCDRCYAVFSGVVRFQLDEKEEEMSKPAGREVLVFDPERRRRRRWLIPSTIAAALALVGVGVAYFFWSRPMAVAKLVAPVEARPDVTSILWDYATYRGTDDADGDSLESDTHAAVQAGALFVDFRLAARAGDTAQAREIWRNIGNAVAKTLAGGEEEAQTFYDDVAAIEKEGKLGEIPASLSKRERHLEAGEIVNPPYFRLGKWVEAGRLAAELAEPKFFTRWANRRFLKSTLADKNMALPEAVLEDLRAIDRAWEGKDYAVLAEHFESILDYYNFRS